MLLSVFGLVLAAATQAAPPPQQQSAPPRGPRSVVPTARDCNLNGIEDLQEISLGGKADCDGNLIPDECDLGRIILLETSFENGIPAGWSASGSWHTTSDCSPLPRCDGMNYAYYGEDDRCTFENSSFSGLLTAPTVVVPSGATSLELSFCSAYEGEGAEPYDAADVFVNGDLVDHVSPQAQDAWEVRTRDLTSYLGDGPITVSFLFTEMDDVSNDFRGWQVDDVRLSFGVGEVLADCNRNGVPDGCDLDCDLSGTPDECEVALGLVADCNLNGVPDSCDVALGSSADCNLNLVPDECDLSSSLTGALANLEVVHPVITAGYTDGYNFNGGRSGNCFTIGLQQAMYDCGGRMNTNLASGILFTNSSVAASPAFGAGSQYFTAKHPGLFVMGATGCSIDTFEISGPTVALAGIVNTLELNTQLDGQQYKIYVKRMYDAFSPSINQIMIIPSDGTGVTHTVPADPSSSSQTLDGLAGIDRIFYVLVSRYDSGVGGLPLRPVDAREIALELLRAVPAPVSADLNGNGTPDECD